MRFLILATVLLSALFFAVPETSYAQLVPCNGPECQACHFVQLGTNILDWIITVMSTICALVIVVAGFKMVTAGGDTGQVSEARSMITNTIVGFIILLAAWLIVDTVLKVFVSGSATGTGAAEIPGFGPWNRIQCVPPPPPPPTGGGTTGTATTTTATTTTTGTCRYTLSTYSGIEESSPLQWANTDPALQMCAQRELGGSVSSAYRTDAYQAHLFALHNTWCTLGLQNDTTQACASVRSSVSNEMTRHQLSCSRPVARSSSNHSLGISVDINGSGPQRSTACFIWYGPADRVHYTLRNECRGDCNPNN